MNNFLIKILFTGLSLFYHPSSSILIARVQKKWNPLNIHGSFPDERKSMILWSKPVSNNSNVAKAYGKRSFWESSYEESLDESAASDISFSWYCRWEDLSPFVEEWMRLYLLTPFISIDEDEGEPYSVYFSSLLRKQRILLPGVGNDPLLLDMVQEGYTNISAFDYAPSAIRCCEQMLEEKGKDYLKIVDLKVADARELQKT